MQFLAKSGQPQSQKTDCAVIPWFDNGKLPAGLRALDKACGNVIGDAARRGDLNSKVGSTTLLANAGSGPSRRLLVVGCGKQAAFDRKAYVKVTGIAATALLRTGAADAISYLASEKLQAGKKQAGLSLALDTTAAVEQSTYRFDAMKSKQNRQKTPTLKR
ncbi:MAG: hypothetical protein HKO07_06225, partial [Pseudomonadales bacterium]|nr:hypothetical protein [Pseudomonadales bacterium]